MGDICLEEFKRFLIVLAGEWLLTPSLMEISRRPHACTELSLQCEVIGRFLNELSLLLQLCRGFREILVGVLLFEECLGFALGHMTDQYVVPIFRELTSVHLGDLRGEDVEPCIVG